jgi:hypothetical protein
VESVFEILRSRTLRASGVWCLNDASEIAYGTSVLCEVLRSCDAVPGHVKNALCGYEDASRQPPVDLMDLIRRLSLGEAAFLKLADKLPCYAACFCGDGNLLSQWRAYGKEGGLSVGFDRHLLGTSEEPGMLMSVIYEPDEQRDVARDAVGIIAETSSKLSEDVDRTAYWIAAAAGFMTTFVARCKSAEFSEEREWRLIRYEKREVQFRTTPRMVVPYVALPFSPDVVRELVLGPTLANPAVVERSFRMFLNSAGFEHVKIRHSGIPLRSL